ncbi:MAG: AAA family ATPase, partial [Myxococcales bacterium]|nr:AAA family ATPase [Myxococcales bacterium]
MLERDFSARLTPHQVEEITDLASEDFWPARGAISPFEVALSSVSGLTVSEGLLAGTFQYQMMPMVRDLEANIEMLAESDLVAAVAGNTSAMDRIRSEVGTVHRADPNSIPPSDEFLVLDADPSQNYAINAAIAGRNIVIQGPPGTGKSQTISNLIAAAVGHGRTVLFVAEKRAAIDAVLNRLRSVGLESLVMDLRDGATNKAKAASEIRSAIVQAGQVTRPDAADVHQRLERTRERLLHRVDALHRIREPWGISVFDAQAMALALPERMSVDVRLPPDVIEALDHEAINDWRNRFDQAQSRGMFSPIEGRSPWASASGLVESDVEKAYDVASFASRQALPSALQNYQEVSRATGLPAADCVMAWSRPLSLLKDVQRVLNQWDESVFSADLGSLIRGCAPRSVRRERGWQVSWRARRDARRTALALYGSKVGVHVLYEDLVKVSATLTAWREVAGDVTALPTLPDLSGPIEAHEALLDALGTLAGYLQRDDLHALNLQELAALLKRLAADPGDVARTAQDNELSRQIHAAGLDPVVNVIRACCVGGEPEAESRIALQILDHVWCRSLLDRVTITDPAIGQFDGSEHHKIARDFANTDRKHIESTPARIRRLHAERIVDIRNRHGSQVRNLDTELSKKRRIKPLRDLIRTAPDVIPATKPCWAMSPLVVSQVLPACMRFDIVVFDEASQVKPAYAIPALARARKAVICGDSRQLPPTSFFDEAEDEGDEPALDPDSDEGPVDNLDPLTDDTESILDAFETALGSSLASQYRLLWHYRSRDARLIAFSDAWFYDRSLLTFPGTIVEPPLQHRLVSHPPGQPQHVMNEVDTVIDLILEHVEERPEKSLGVIAMSKQHADRLANALDQRLRDLDDPVISEFFLESADESFFVKNLERVQGDERDAIIVSLGYVKRPDGRMQYRFGPINIRGGER